MDFNQFSNEVAESLTKYAKNPWRGTVLEEYYTLTPKAKGCVGEILVGKILDNLGHKVENRTDPGHDYIIDGVPTEVKFALTTDRNSKYECIFNHIGFKKSWEQIILCCVNGDLSFRAVLYTKETLSQMLLSHQQGGKDSDNDDFMCSGKSANKLLFDEKAIVIVG
jgi:hypothetical protein